MKGQARRSARHLAALLWLACLLVACGSGQPASLASLFPAANAAQGWSAAGQPEMYPAERFADLVDGAAEGYLAYGCDQVGVSRYAAPGKPGLKVEIWQAASPADAYGLYTTMQSGSAVPVGNEGLLNTGRQLMFWQNRYYVRVSAVEAVGDDDLQAMGRAVAAALPKGGERPALLKRLPAAGLVAGSESFFRNELSVQGRVWLGGENRLQLGRDVEGVLADYDLGGANATLLLVRYPDGAKASAALAALKQQPPDDLQASRANGNVLGAVTGTVGQAEAEGLLARALQ